MTNDEFIAEDTAAAAELAEAQQKAADTLTAALNAAHAAYTEAIQRAQDVYSERQAAAVKAHGLARAAEVREAVRKANAEAGLDEDGNPLKDKPTPPDNGNNGQVPTDPGAGGEQAKTLRVPAP